MSNDEVKAICDLARKLQSRMLGDRDRVYKMSADTIRRKLLWYVGELTGLRLKLTAALAAEKSIAEIMEEIRKPRRRPGNTTQKEPEPGATTEDAT